jgi:hypothetical protein
MHYISTTTVNTNLFPEAVTLRPLALLQILQNLIKSFLTNLVFQKVEKSI